MKKLNVSIIGAAGYTGGELLRLLIHHDNIESITAVSQSQKGKQVSDVFSDLIGEVELEFSSKANEKSDIIFLCLQHGDSENYLKENAHLLNCKIIDLSRDFRLTDNNSFDDKNFVYGLPELNKEKIKTANYIANPGCFATAIQLALLPFAKNNLLKGTIQVTAVTGSTGAGIKPTETTHFSWRQNNISVYQPFEHPHNAEIKQSLNQLQENFDGEFLFIPQRGNFARGILATTILESDLLESEIKKMFEELYQNEAFTFLIDKTIDLKMVVNTNKCFINIKKHNKHVLITTVIDNLLKGAAGQAVQNMNIMFGLNEQEGLKLKCITY
ncbi:N-acetyl-gamma-glutamyl-phosphate reductase [Sediminibacterium sp.]|uniref:N-acetyl-gamma-glutamyl-phosphate reductase n=1 Tax=Sediminibacterium sp. TaxID=1917865 RepID=UPI002736C997|nr:N-acetyl-gamma-glutamyl-phosphate reductase [Sediminibacterium sp.]MDP3567376.1 N-acetyl-gamma-glutamyl-phosphate reductase [Sediminibacterium sp.]